MDNTTKPDVYNWAHRTGEFLTPSVHTLNSITNGFRSPLADEYNQSPRRRRRPVPEERWGLLAPGSAASPSSSVRDGAVHSAQALDESAPPSRARSIAENEVQINVSTESPFVVRTPVPEVSGPAQASSARPVTADPAPGQLTPAQPTPLATPLLTTPLPSSEFNFSDIAEAIQNVEVAVNGPDQIIIVPERAVAEHTAAEAEHAARERQVPFPTLPPAPEDEDPSTLFADFDYPLVEQPRQPATRQPATRQARAATTGERAPGHGGGGHASSAVNGNYRHSMYDNSTPQASQSYAPDGGPRRAQNAAPFQGLCPGRRIPPGRASLRSAHGRSSYYSTAGTYGDPPRAGPSCQNGQSPS